MQTLSRKSRPRIASVVAVFYAFCASISVHAQSAASADNVILVMLDGVRWREVFDGDMRSPIFRNLWRELIPEGMIFGNRINGTEMTVSNGHNISLPAYQSIMAGATQGCSSNGCGRVGVETVQERIKRELGLLATQVATIASWNQIPNAVEHKFGATFTNAAFEDLNDGTDDAEFKAINQAQAQDLPPWAGSRFDRYTWLHAMHYLAKHQPRFLFISLNDSDEWAHKGEWTRYLETLRTYDAYIRELVAFLGKMGTYGQRTMLIVTTDHGRGDGGDWKHHGWPWSASKYIWLYGRPARGSSISPPAFAEAGYSHIDVRPTIEAALGLTPISCRDCGRVIWQLVPGAKRVPPPVGRRGSILITRTRAANR